MPAGLLEREDELAALHAAVAAARAGRGCVVLVGGEAGIGKSSLIREFIARVDDGVLVLVGACDDLLAPRALGPLRDAARGTGGPLEQAMTGVSEAVFGAVVAQLTALPGSVLVVEDVQWADDATLDVLRYLARRIEALPAVLVISYREEAVGTGRAVHDLLGALASTPAVRLRPAPLSQAAVSQLSRAVGRDGSAVHAATGGNPFYVTETLAAAEDGLPVSVADAVLARLRLLSPECIAALEQLSVVPTLVELPLAEALLGDGLEPLAQAEERGIIEVGPAGLAFRHELARRAVEAAMPQLRRRVLNRGVVQVLRDSKHPDVERLVHHGVEAADPETIVEFAPQAGRAAAAAGSHRQALAHLEAAAAHLDLLPPLEQARLVDDLSWELYIAHRFTAAVAAGRDAVRRYEELGDPVLTGTAMVRLSRYVFMTGSGSDEAEQLSGRAVEMLRERGSTLALAAASTYYGATLTLTGQLAEAMPVLREALALAVEAARPDLESLCLNYLGLARAGCGEPAQGEADMRFGLAVALAGGSHEAAARAFVNLGEMLHSYGEWEALAENADTGLAYAAEHGLGQFIFLLELQRHQVRVHRGEWDTAERGLRELVERGGEPSMFDPFALSAYGKLLARRGRPEAGEILERAWSQARTQRLPLAMTQAGKAMIDWAWFTGNTGVAREVAEVLLPRMRGAGWAYLRGGLLRQLVRAGLPGEPFEGCPEVYAAGLRRDWRTAAALWQRIGNPYERALELADSGEAEATLEGLRILQDLGASAPADLVRRRLRALGVTRRPPPRRPDTARPNPAGLTARQLDVLDLLGEGATNAEIASRLVLSVRTVDHHVAAILSQLGVRTRREAVAAVRRMEAKGRT